MNQRNPQAAPLPKFSRALERWLQAEQPKTFASLSEVFREKTFAIIFLLLMFIPALPLPTGGITHIFEIITILLALEVIIGRDTVWLPKKWRGMRLGKLFERRTIPFIIRRVRWFERFSRPRWSGLMRQQWFSRLFGVVVLVFALSAFLAPPFSGLDTLPALGVVVISLGIILEDALLFVIGSLIGLAGIVLIIGIGTALTQALRHIF